MRICAIVYQMAVDLDSGLSDVKDFSITFASVDAFSETGAVIRNPRTWRFAAPQYDGFVVNRYGASETRGIFGGVPNERQRTLSEACERAIAEIITVLTCELVDREKGVVCTDILIFGPALPKVVGRLASLRLPDTIRIRWLCPFGAAEWIARESNEVVLVPRYPIITRGAASEVQQASAWEDESLISGFEVQLPESKTTLLVQDLCQWEDNAGIREYDLHGVSTRFLVSAAEIWLPREIALCAGCIDAHTESPVPEAQIERPPVISDRYITTGETGLCVFTTQRLTAVPGWSVDWGPAPTTDFRF